VRRLAGDVSSVLYIVRARLHTHPTNTPHTHTQREVKLKKRGRCSRDEEEGGGE